MKVVIVGGVAGGASTAARLRRLDENMEITMFERTGYISYANCGLPYYIGDVIKDKKNLTLQTPKSFYDRFNVNVKVKHEVIDIDTVNKTVKVKDLLTSNVFDESYDKLVLSPGAKPIIPSFYKEDNRIFTLRTVEDTYKIKTYINNNNTKSVTIIGGGFIGVEMADNLKELGMDVSIVQSSKQLLKMLDSDMASFVHSTMKSRGVNLYLGRKVMDINPQDDKIITALDNDISLVSDIIILAVGVKPDNKLAKLANLELGVNGAIRVNSSMLTSNPDIYAVGDAVTVTNFVTKEEALITLAGPANRQGRIAADNICGIPSEYKGSQGSSIIKVFDLDVASTGITERECINRNINYEKVILSPASHATYYPNAKVLTLKVIYDKDSLNLLGAQIVGYDGVDKRIDVLATLIRLNAKAYDLKDLELAYAPPYSSAKDPVNMAGFIIDNILNGIVKQFDYNKLSKLDTNSVILLDTRTKFEYEKGHAKGFINIPLDDLRNRIDELDKNKDIYVMCQSGLRSYIAVRILVQNGYNAYNFIGGYRLYSSIRNDEKLIEETYTCGMDK